MHTKRAAFSMLELVFVIVVMGILAKFGTELFLQIYENYTRSTIVNDLDTKSETAIQEIANRMSYRLKDSVIATTGPNAAFSALENATTNDTVIEWINRDTSGWNNGNYSGVIDLTSSTKTQLSSPGTVVGGLPAGGAILFKGANVSVQNGFGWHSSNANNLHIYSSVTTAGIIPFSGANQFVAGDDIYEYYQVAKSATALVYDTTDSTNPKIILYDGYQPWNGANYGSVNGHLLVDHVKTVSVKKVGDVILVVLCLSDNDFMKEGEYSICKTKTVF